MRSVLVILSLCLCATLLGADAPPVKKLASADIDKLVQQLGSDDFQKRQDAEKQLDAQGEAARPALEKAFAGSKDEEIKQRSGKLLKLINMPRELAKLSPARREVADLPLKSEEGGEVPAGQLKTCVYGRGDDTLIDMGPSRIVVEGMPGNGSSSSSTMSVSGGGRSSTRSGSFSASYAGGVCSFDLRGIKWTLSDNTIKIADKELKVGTATRQVIFVDKSGKLISAVEIPIEKKDNADKDKGTITKK